MVMIADQTEEEYLRRCPENKFCEYIDGVVYLHSSASNLPDPSELPIDPEDPSKVWYDRSSLVGDFMVMIPDQTEEDYFRRCPEGQFCEYIDGVVYMPSPATLWHQFDTQLLAFLLEGFTAGRELVHVLTGPAVLRLREECNVEPDLFVIPFQTRRSFEGYICDPPVLLVVEVLSRSTRSHDLNEKATLYREAGAIEVWFIDDRDKGLIIHRRTEDGYEVLRIGSGSYVSTAIPGFWFEVSWLWARPRPNVMECLQAILAGPPA
jgi:Uma2 family endonuclease